MSNEMEQLAPKRRTQKLLGVVVSNADKSKSGRLQVRIDGHHDGVTAESLPWAAPAEGNSTGNALLMIPALGSPVWISYQNDSEEHPIWEYCGLPNGASSLGVLAVNYPERMGFLGRDGSYIFLDQTNGNIQVKSSSGCSIDLSGNKVTITAGAGLTQNNGPLIINVTGDTSITTSGSTKIATSGTTDISSSGKCKVSSEADVDVTAGGNCNVEGASVAIKGGTISLN